MRFYHCSPFVFPLLPSVATIGSFDGAHLGHKKILTELKVFAKKRHLATTVISFEPLPKEYFLNKKSPPRLHSLAEKFNYLESQNIDQFVCLRFNKALMGLRAQDFIEKILIEKFQVKVLVVGEDFRFGKNRLGDTTLLKDYAARGHFELSVVPRVDEDGVKISSSAIRNLLVQGDFLEVKKILGRPYTISGKVIHGQKRGRTLNFPTANIRLGRKSTPLHGVYVVRVEGRSSQVWMGVANIGYRPTVEASLRLSLEVYLFADHDLDLYGQYLRVEFLYKIRDEKKFDSIEALKKQIEVDVAVAREYVDTKVAKAYDVG